MEKILLPEIKDFHLIDVYASNGGYNSAKKAFSQTPDEIIDQVKKSGLRGRGGAVCRKPLTSQNIFASTVMKVNLAHSKTDRYLNSIPTR
ncbi:MAG: hypothetical protein MUE93_07145 [Ignavibacteriaceae bacterium]|nr:hypothetical protein [Ignavibacteriaceae bacterium]